MELEFDVVELPPHDAPTEGDEAPEFVRPLVNDEYWEDTALSEVVPALVVFYPMNGSFPATYIWKEVRDRGWTDETTVVGVTVSTPYSHKSFLQRYGLETRLFADPSNEAAREYGVVHDLDGMEGVEEPRPAVFLIDDEMHVEYAWVAEEHPEFPPYEEIENAL